MFLQNQLSNQSTFFQKIKSIDYILLLCVLAIGVISGFAMYISDGGELLPLETHLGGERYGPHGAWGWGSWSRRRTRACPGKSSSTSGRTLPE